jgi:prophage maintenance system killer protein
MSMWIPSLEDVMRLHTKVTRASGGSDGVRELGLVESALARASAGFGGVELYPDLVGKAAAADAVVIVGGQVAHPGQAVIVAVCLVGNACALGDAVA